MSSRVNRSSRSQEESEYGSLSDSAVREIDKQKAIERIGQILLIALAVILYLVSNAHVFLNLP